MAGNKRNTDAAKAAKQGTRRRPSGGYKGRPKLSESEFNTGIAPVKSQFNYSAEKQAATTKVQAWKEELNKRVQAQIAERDLTEVQLLALEIQELQRFHDMAVEAGKKLETAMNLLDEQRRSRVKSNPELQQVLEQKRVAEAAARARVRYATESGMAIHAIAPGSAFWEKLDELETALKGEIEAELAVYAAEVDSLKAFCDEKGYSEYLLEQNELFAAKAAEPKGKEGDEAKASDEGASES